jgi:hypothetical protein
VNATLAYCGLFWSIAAISYAFAVRRGNSGPLAIVTVVSTDLAYAVALPVTVVTSGLFYLTEGQSRLPVSLVTPLALVANFYMVPACVIWWDHFRRAPCVWRLRGIHLVVLVPALVRGWLSPYRENLSPLLLIPLLATLFAGRRPSFRKLAAISLIFFLMASTAIGAYRRIKWESVTPDEVTREIREAGLTEWISGSWAEPLHRFHAFDSMLLTLALVPSARPYSGRNVLVAPFVRAVVPRFLYQNKGAADESTKFGARIWAFDDPWAREHSDAAIAPSMPGDLFEAGGIWFVALGAGLWGLLLGVIDGWTSHLPSFAAAASMVLIATQCVMSVERDFDNTVATFLQTILAFLFVAAILWFAQRNGEGFSPSTRGSAELSQC